MILPGLPGGTTCQELLSSPAMKTFMEDITQRYPTTIIFDLPPCAATTPWCSCPNADACLLVVEDGATGRTTSALGAAAATFYAADQHHPQQRRA